MASNGHSEERRGLTHSFRSQMGYGTAAVSAATKKSTPKTRSFISKKVQRTDTLMGIALKYGVTVQELKKENKLWNNDHLFLRETLLIPLTSENEHVKDKDDTIVVFDGNNFVSNAAAAGAGAGTSSPPLSSSSSPVSQSSSSLSPASSVSSPLQNSSPNINPTNGCVRKGPPNGERVDRSVSDASDEGISAVSSHPASPGQTKDFFSKYDSDIARLKGDIDKMESNASLASPVERSSFSSSSSSSFLSYSATHSSTTPSYTVPLERSEVMESETRC